MEATHENKDKELKKPKPVETAEKLISEKRAEKTAESRQVVQESAEGVQTEVADVMAGVEAPKEKVSERKGETGETGDITGGAQQAAGAQAAVSAVAARGLPTQEIMIKKIRVAINTQIKLEIKKARKLHKNLSSGTAQEYNSSIAKIRRLKETLQSLITGTFEYIKKVYQKYFAPSGGRKPLDGV